MNAAEAWEDFARSDYGSVPILRLRPLDFDPDLVLRDLYDLPVETVTDPALHTLFRAKRDEIARQVTTLEHRDSSRFLYGSLQLYGGVSPTLVASAETLLGTIPALAPGGQSVTAGAFADAAREEVVEINAESPGGMQSIERLYGMDGCVPVIESLERRVASRT